MNEFIKSVTPSNILGNSSTTTNTSTITMPPKSIDTIDGTMSHCGNSNATTCLIGTTNGKMTNLSTMNIPERDTKTHGESIVTNIKMKSMNCKSIPQRPIAGPTKLTIQSIPVKSQPPMLSSNLSNQRKVMHSNLSDNQIINGIVNAHNINNSSNNNHNNKINGNNTNNRNNNSVMKSTPSGQNKEASQNLMNQQKNTIVMRTHHHGSANELVRSLQRVQECHSSSDENRSSGHASMSDTGHGSSSPGCGEYHICMISLTIA